METIFKNTLNNKTNEFNRFIYQFTDKLNLKIPNENMALANLSIYYIWKNIKSEYNNNKFKVSAPTWNDELNLSDGSYSVSDIQDHFEYIIKKHETTVDNPPVQIYVNKIKNKIVFKIKAGCKLEKLLKETMQLLWSSKKDIDQNKNGEIVPNLETVEFVLVHCNIVKKHHLKYQQASKVLSTFVPNKKFRQFITVTSHSPTMLNTAKAEFSFIEIYFTDQNNRSLEIDDDVNITLITGISYYKN